MKRWWVIPVAMMALGRVGSAAVAPAASQGAATSQGVAASQGAATTQAAAATQAAAFQPSLWLKNWGLDEVVQKNHLLHWLILLGAIFVGVAVGRILSFLLQRAGKKLEGRGWPAYAHVFSGLANPASLALLTLCLTVGLAQIAMGDALHDFVRRVLLLLYTVAGFWYAFNLVAIVEVVLTRLAKHTQTRLDDELIPVARKTLRLFLVVVGLLFVMQNVFERDIGAWLAGLGIAGLAVSLAAQDSIKSLFGTFTILFDRPFAIGHRIRYSGFEGTVENIGFRSTRMRTFDGHVVTIPNSKIVNDPVEDVGQRGSIRRVISLKLAPDMKAEKVEEAVRIIQELLESGEFREPIHGGDMAIDSGRGGDKSGESGGEIAQGEPGAEKKERAKEADEAEKPRVYFEEFGAGSFGVKVFYWYRPPNYWEYMAHGERLNLAVMRAFERSGIKLVGGA